MYLIFITTGLLHFTEKNLPVKNFWTSVFVALIGINLLNLTGASLWNNRNSVWNKIYCWLKGDFRSGIILPGFSIDPAIKFSPLSAASSFWFFHYLPSFKESSCKELASSAFFIFYFVIRSVRFFHTVNLALVAGLISDFTAAG